MFAKTVMLLAAIWLLFCPVALFGDDEQTNGAEKKNPTNVHEPTPATGKKKQPDEGRITVKGNGASYFGFVSSDQKNDARESDGSNATEKNVQAPYAQAFNEAEIKLDWRRDGLNVQYKVVKRSDMKEVETSPLLTWKPNESFDLIMGKILVLETLNFVGLSGTRSHGVFDTGVAYSGMFAHANKMGVQLRYNLFKVLSFGFTYLAEDAYYSAEAQKWATDSLKDLLPGTDDELDNADTEGKGRTLVLGFMGPLSPNTFMSMAYISIVGDKGDGGPVDAKGGTQISFYIKLYEGLELLFSRSHAIRTMLTGIEIILGPVDAVMTASDTGSQIHWQGPGPGKFIFGFNQHQAYLELFGNQLKGFSYTQINTDLLYEIPFHPDKKSGMQLIFLNKSTKYDSNDSFDNYNARYIGAGLYASF